MRDPEKEVERPSASRALTHNVYEELPASSKPYRLRNKVAYATVGFPSANNRQTNMASSDIDGTSTLCHSRQVNVRLKGIRGHAIGNSSATEQ